jgi:plastocyanin/mono/diheme cytochrome c family protein
MRKRPFVIFAILAVLGVLVVPFWALTRRGEESAAAMPIASSDRTAQHLFQTNCGSCHTLAAGGTDGVVGPNLDVLLATGPESKSAADANCQRVLSAIDGGIGGRMPAGILQGTNAELVASFVARNVAYVNTTNQPQPSNEVPVEKVDCAPAPTGGGGGGGPKPGQAGGATAAGGGGGGGGAPAKGGSTLDVSADPSGALAFQQSSLSAKAGKVKIDFTNQSPVQHNVTISDSSGKTLGATQTITGGSTSTSVDLKAGTYTFFCSVPGHEQAGMKGMLTVK